jgi:hypothetical protein
MNRIGFYIKKLHNQSLPDRRHHAAYKHKESNVRGRYGNKFHAFSEYDGFSLIEGQKNKIVSDINSQPDSYILNHRGVLFPAPWGVQCF